MAAVTDGRTTWRFIGAKNVDAIKMFADDFFTGGESRSYEKISSMP